MRFRGSKDEVMNRIRVRAAQLILWFRCESNLADSPLPCGCFAAGFPAEEHLDTGVLQLP